MLSGAALLLDRLISSRHGASSIVVSFVGAGGKTSAIFALAEAARARGLSTIVATTTAMRDPRLENGRRIDVFLDGPPPGRLPPSTLAFVLSDAGRTGELEAGKVKGPSPQSLKAFIGASDLLLIEADGSKRLPIKAPEAHEPVVPEYSQIVVACIGLDAYGRPAEASRVHRLDRFLAVAGLAEGAIIDAAAIGRLVRHPEGSFKGCLPGVRRILLFCKADILPQAVLETLGARVEQAGFVGEVFALSLGAASTDSAPKAVSDGEFLAAPSASGPVIVRGAGDLASGVILRLRRAGYPVLALETADPSAIRRTVAFSEAVRKGSAMVEDAVARLVATVDDAKVLLREGREIPLLVDPEGQTLSAFGPRALIDAIMAKRNLGTSMGMAPFVVALGPGFEAGVDAHAVIETNRGHSLGKVIWKGRAESDTGVPGEIGGASTERVLHAPLGGSFTALEEIGARVSKGQIIGYINNNKKHFNMYSKIDGILRGILPEGYPVTKDFKVADVDPRARVEHCHSVSDKALAIGGAVLEALLAKGVLP